MKPSSIFLAVLAPAAVLAEPLSPETPSLVHHTDSLVRRAPFATIPESYKDHLPDPSVHTKQRAPSNKRAARNVLQARSEGSLGQTPWIGMAIGLTCTALAAVMLG
ncbi:hypothetical protein POX_d05053 [Penicillium oxalicum]|uniref:Uncharacterized protein n=1 Tax=Penicillium oxalicum (strain 114-2 / CGMCC 5302) TaxID=933388 RepID=S7ZQW9_PENO1|nr:hypothetical protein POX_d05053 [Penicillium oxalicum]EPS32794.1 hypothetical protein PDE_07754 [Penicillium oxalicum 114-2]KAI2789559.1 hypothetical protein POX_d05053 [Penicillium oxalicum]